MKKTKVIQSREEINKHVLLMRQRVAEWERKKKMQEDMKKERDVSH